MPRSFGTHGSDASQDTSFEAIAINHHGDFLAAGYTMATELITDSTGINVSGASDMSWFNSGSSYTPILHYYCNVGQSADVYDAYHFNFGTNTKFIGADILPSDVATKAIAENIIAGYVRTYTYLALLTETQLILATGLVNGSPLHFTLTVTSVKNLGWSTMNSHESGHPNLLYFAAHSSLMTVAVWNTGHRFHDSIQIYFGKQ
jgi:hypothetical protein